jgi:DNA-binding Lrp family transcriptional regulator
MDELDRAIINGLQGGFEVVERPFLSAALRLHTTEAELIERIEKLLADGTLTRFGPLFQIERLGGAFSLAAMRVPPGDFDHVAEIVNAFPEVAHNYAREHAFNMWFVLATGNAADIEATIARIEAAAGYPVLNLPKLREYFVDLKLNA